MAKTLAKIVLSAFVAGLVAETAYTIYSGSASIDTAIELAICWAVILATAVSTIWKTINGTLVRTIVDTVVVHHWHDAENPEGSEDTPEETPEE